MERLLQNEALARIKTLMDAEGMSKYHIGCQADLVEGSVKHKIDEALHEMEMTSAEIKKWIDALLEEE